MSKPLSERLNMLLREHRKTMSHEVLKSWADDALVEMVEAAALARRVEGAAHGYVDGFGSIHAAGIESDYHGQRVALVPVEGGA